MHARRLLLNLALLLVVAGLAAFVFWPRPAPTPSGMALVPAFDAAAVHHIRIERAGKPALAFERHDGLWQMVAPLKARANPLLMRALLALPQARSTQRYAVAQLDLGQYGLSPPQADIQLGKTRIALGISNPLDQRRYVLHDGWLYLIQDPLASLPESPALDWVSLTLLPPGAQIVALHLPGLEIRANRPAGWTLKPTPKHYSADQVGALLNAWRDATALRLTPAHASEAPHSRTVRIKLADGTQQRFQIIATHPNLVLRDPTLHADYYLPGALAAQLLQLPEPSLQPQS